MDYLFIIIFSLLMKYFKFIVVAFNSKYVISIGVDKGAAIICLVIVIQIQCMTGFSPPQTHFTAHRQ